jgi:hypothetical protein
MPGMRVPATKDSLAPTIWGADGDFFDSEMNQCAGTGYKTSLNQPKTQSLMQCFLGCSSLLLLWRCTLHFAYDLITQRMES